MITVALVCCLVNFALLTFFWKQKLPHRLTDLTKLKHFSNCTYEFHKAVVTSEGLKSLNVKKKL